MHAVKALLSRRTFVATTLAGGIELVRQVVPAGSQNRSEDMETTIRADANMTTLINIVSVEPDNQQKLVELLDRRAVQHVRRMDFNQLATQPRRQARRHLFAVAKPEGHSGVSPKYRGGLLPSAHRGTRKVRVIRVRRFLRPSRLISMSNPAIRRTSNHE